jgi:hypothetical protein
MLIYVKKTQTHRIEKVGEEKGIVCSHRMPSYDLLKNVPFELDKYMLSIRNC